MGFYYDDTTDIEDANYIIDGMENGEIDENFYWLTDNEEELLDQYIVWKPDLSGNVIINGAIGKLTSMGVNYIMYRLRIDGRLPALLGYT